MAEQISEFDGFSFDHDLHEYRNGAGEVRPSVTQTLQAGGLFNYHRIDPQVVERKRRIGDEVHAWTARHDISNGEENDLLDLTRESQIYGEAHLRWWDLMHKRIEVLGVETRMLKLLHGLEVGGTLDLKVRLDRVRIVLIERKCSEQFHAAWRLQLADYAMLDSERSDCCSRGRAVLQYLNNGKFRYTPIDPQWDRVDSAVAVSFLTTYVWRYNHRLL